MSIYWYHSIMVIRFDENHGQQIVGKYGGELTLCEMNDIKMLSMPENLQNGASEVKFCFRVRNKETNVYFNCYSLFRQYPDITTKRGYFSQSVVLISKLPFIGLSYSVLNRLADVLVDIPTLEEKISGRHLVDASRFAASDKSGIIDQALEIAFQHFERWPVPKVGLQLSLPFYGSILSYLCPSIPSYLDVAPAPAPSTDDGLDGGMGVFHENSLMQLSLCGLLPHLWTLFELVVTGKDVVVWSESAELCSKVCTTLCSLTAPLAYAGDFRPYINISDSDLAAMAADPDPLPSDPAPHLGGSGRVVGITNPFLLRTFAKYSSAIFLPSGCVAHAISAAGRAPHDASNANTWSSSLMTMVGLRKSPALAAAISIKAKLVAAAGKSLEAEFDSWISSSKSASQGLLCLRTPPRVQADPAILQRVASIRDSVASPAQVETVCNMLLREYLRGLNMALLRPLDPLLQVQVLGPPEGDECEFGTIRALVDQLFDSADSSASDAIINHKLATSAAVRPKCLCITEFRQVLLEFAHSPHFLKWCRYRRKRSLS